MSRAAPAVSATPNASASPGGGLKGVPEQRQPPGGAQRTGRGGRARDRVHPVPGLPGHRRVEPPPGRIPLLDLRHLDLDPGLPGQAGHPRVRVDPEHPAARRLELPGHDARAAADVQDLRPGLPSMTRSDQRLRIARPGPLVALGVGCRRLGDLAVLEASVLGGGETGPSAGGVVMPPTVVGTCPLVNAVRSR